VYCSERAQHVETMFIQLIFESLKRRSQGCLSMEMPTGEPMKRIANCPDLSKLCGSGE
jgi:hypothetical protein